MAKRGGNEQLHLELQYDYLRQLLTASEEPACYEAAARAFLGEALPSIEKSPVWDELSRMDCCQ